MKKSAMLSMLSLMMLLPGCGALERFNPEPVYLVRCPDMPKYTQEFRARLADEIETLGFQSATQSMIADYLTVRDACRAVKAGN